MDKFKEFQARDLDKAILDACEYYAVPRERLEIEIIQDAKTGIFGIVGARKAKIRARRAHVQETVEQLLGDSGPGADLADTRGRPRRRKGARQPEDAELARERPGASGGQRQADESQQRKSAGPAKKSGGDGRDSARERPEIGAPETGLENAAAKKRGRQDSPKPLQHGETESGISPDFDHDDGELPDAWPQIPVEELDQNALVEGAAAVVGALVRPIAGENIRVEVELDGSKVLASIHDIQDSGLLIGRDGQTLAAIQYLASRMVSKAMNAGIRIKLDVGEYRQKQDEKVREMALLLAQKVLKTGRSYSTRPLSSYHRRLVHLCLQEMPEIQTRSAGEGSLKRVVIMRKKAERAQ